MWLEASIEIIITAQHKKTSSRAQHPRVFKLNKIGSARNDRDIKLKHKPGYKQGMTQRTSLPFNNITLVKTHDKR